MSLSKLVKIYIFMTTEQGRFQDKLAAASPYSDYANLTERFLLVLGTNGGIAPEKMQEIATRLGINAATENGTFSGGEKYFKGFNGDEPMEDQWTGGHVALNIIAPFNKALLEFKGHYPFRFRELQDAFDPYVAAKNLMGFRARDIPFLEDLNLMGEGKADLFKTLFILNKLVRFYRDKIGGESRSGHEEVGSLKERVESFEENKSSLGDYSPEAVERYLRKIYLDGTGSTNPRGKETLPVLFALGRFERMTKVLSSLIEKSFAAEERSSLFEAMTSYTFLRSSSKQGVLSKTRKEMVAFMKEGKYDEAKKVADAYGEFINQERAAEAEKRRR